MLRIGLIAVALSLALASPAAAKSPAACGPGDRPEPALQGQVPKANWDDSVNGYWCGMRAVGRSTIDDRGGNYQMAWSGDCATSRRSSSSSVRSRTAWPSSTRRIRGRRASPGT